MGIHYEYAYEVVAIIFSALVIVCNERKNWLDMRVNRYFHQLTNCVLMLTVMDLIVHCYVQYLADDIQMAKYFVIIMHGCATTTIVWMFFRYYTLLSGYAVFATPWEHIATLVPVIVGNALVLSTPFTGWVLSVAPNGTLHRGSLHIVMVLIVLGYLLGMCIMAFFGPSRLPAVYTIISLVLCIAGLGIGLFQLSFKRYLLLCYAANFMLVIFYLIFQNHDRYSDRVSGGFSRSGFRKVLKEKFIYRERFSCLFVIIKNYNNIIGLCENDEFDEVQKEIGTILRRYGGRHNQFHIHGSDHAVLQKREKESIELHKRILNQLPEYVQVVNRKVPINYGFFMLTLEEASYDQSEFYKMVASMKKLLGDQMDPDKLMRYEGEVRKNIDLELYIARKLKEIMKKKRCEMCFTPIMGAKSRDRHVMEARIYMCKENGKLIEEGSIWAVAREMGYLRKLGRITAESAFELAEKEHFLEHGFHKMAINVTPMHISSNAVLREYRFLAKKYHFPLNRFCLEVTEDVSVPFDEMKQYITELRKDGISLILDHFGSSVCNLQGIMNMPFNFVKISKRIVNGYCSGESDILEYQIKMLRDNGWNICLSGIDDEASYEKIKDLPDLSYAQGDYYSTMVTPERLHLYLEEG